ncbi:MAG TPA: hypothetical protein VEH27_13855 [Methylomirabilota bacterium]|nr:hypothetical protein [Methylomirabilota bacterium]
MRDDDYSEEHLEILRKLTPEQKLKQAFQLYWFARRLKAAWLRQQHPQWTEEQAQEEVRRVFLHATT